MTWTSAVSAAYDRRLDPPDDCDPEYECEACGNTEYFTESGDKYEGEVTCNECGHCVYWWDNIPDNDDFESYW